MRLRKRGLAMAMALLLMVPTQPVMAARQSPPDILETGGEKEEKRATSGNAERKESTSEEKKSSSQQYMVTATPKNARKALAVSEAPVTFNTGNHEYQVVTKEEFLEQELGDAFFEEDGSYTINIPEENPFFPYEVQFSYDGEVMEKWFMDPDDSVEIGGHTFYVSANFDGTVVTQLSFKVAGDTVIVYPDRKEFTNEEEAEAQPRSLLPLETRSLNVDFTAYTPAELTMVTVDELFMGGELADGSKVMWNKSNDDYIIMVSGDTLNFSYDTCYGNPLHLEMIVGDDNQLAPDNIRYNLTVELTLSEKWLVPTVYTQDNEGNRFEEEVLFSSSLYRDYDEDNREMYIYTSSVPVEEGKEEEENKEEAYIRFDINDDVFPEKRYHNFKIYEGFFTSAAEAETGTEITDQICNADMTQTDAGYLVVRDNEVTVTMITYDSEGQVTGCLPFNLFWDKRYNSLDWSDLRRIKDGNSVDVVDDSSSQVIDGIWYITQTLYKGNAANEMYYFRMDYNKFDPDTYDNVIAAYVGKYSSVEEAQQAGASDIKEELFHYPGYSADYSQGVFFTIFANGERKTNVYYYHLQAEEGENRYNPLRWYYLERMKDGNLVGVVDYASSQVIDGIWYITQTLYKGNAANEMYYFKMGYAKVAPDISYSVIAAYVGKYSSVEEAQQAGASDIKEELLYPSSGYGADYSQGVFFTIFINEEGETNVYYYHLQTEEKSNTPSVSSAWVNFRGLVDRDGDLVEVYKISSSADSYADGSYQTILVPDDVDLTDLAPEFSISEETNLYVSGSTEPEVSGESYHDFSGGPVQYSYANKTSKAKQIWLQVVHVGAGNGNLYINSLADEEAKTRVENGIIYSTREMLLDGRYGYQHDILLVNTGSEPIPAISVELASDEVELDKYWTLDGDYELSDISHGETDSSWQSYGNLWNMAKLRFKPREGMADGRDITGTLTIKSGDTTLIVLTLTGTVGDPSIVTKEIPPTIVKYVPYGTMIQSNNKYDWNDTTFHLIDGKLPEGMEVRKSGELYGVPLEAGEFTFTVHMENSFEAFAPSERTFTITVLENTDENVGKATDEGYEIIKIDNMRQNTIYDQLVISEGEFLEFQDLYLDGVKLTKGVDYTAESGSVLTTVASQTFRKFGTVGKHTIAFEFRTGESKDLKRSAKNYEVLSSSGGGSRSSRGSSRTSNSANISTAAAAAVPQDATKGYVDDQAGIIAKDETGYSRWLWDGTGWKLVYANGTMAMGSIIELPDGTKTEQVLWEKINGIWYAFGITGYLKSGWVYDYQLGKWYCLTPENGLYSGWYGDQQDNSVYYMEPGTGDLAVGWKQIDGKWYYFNAVISPIPTWNFNAITGEWEYNALIGGKPYGAMYHDEWTPDGYYVGADGVWDSQKKRQLRFN